MIRCIVTVCALRFPAGTATVELRPPDNESMRLEYRHDVAHSAMFFAHRVQVDANGQPIADAQGPALRRSEWLPGSEEVATCST